MPPKRLWNWQQPDWPHFTFDAERLKAREALFLLRAGLFMGICKHIGDTEKIALAIDIMSDEATKTSEIEGEYLNRDSIQSSIRRELGIATDLRRVRPAEQGIADMTVDVYRNFAGPLSEQVLFAWHRMVMNGRADLEIIGGYRKHKEPMQIISGRVDAPKIHFEAPPSEKLQAEMGRFIVWFNATAPGGKTPLPALTRASLAHLYFVSIHPFEDGNGRLARALAEKSLAQSLAKPSLLALSQTIQSRRKAYYDMLEASNASCQVDVWLNYFADTLIAAQEHTNTLVEFLIAKARFYDRLRDNLNARQGKVIERMFREGAGGFKGGLSTEKYISITGTSRATASRDLSDLLNKKALVKTGVGRGTRYGLDIAQTD